jgi:hypothetical protein
VNSKAIAVSKGITINSFIYLFKYNVGSTLYRGRAVGVGRMVIYGVSLKIYSAIVR